MTATLSHSDLSTILLVLALACLAGAAYMAYLQSVLGVALFLVVALVIFLVAD